MGSGATHTWHRGKCGTQGQLFDMAKLTISWGLSRHIFFSSKILNNHSYQDVMMSRSHRDFNWRKSRLLPIYLAALQLSPISKTFLSLVSWEFHQTWQRPTKNGATDMYVVKLTFWFQVVKMQACVTLIMSHLSANLSATSVPWCAAQKWM